MQERKDQMLDELPLDLTCPISLEEYKNPVFYDDGRFYERDMIRIHEQKSRISPMTNKPFRELNLPAAREKMIRLVCDFKELNQKWRNKVQTLDVQLASAKVALANRDRTISSLKTTLSKTENLSDELFLEAKLTVDDYDKTIALLNKELREANAYIKDLHAHVDALEAMPTGDESSLKLKDLQQVESLLLDIKSIATNHDNEFARLKMELKQTKNTINQSATVSSQFLTAVSSLSLSQIQYFLREGVDINTRDIDSKETALMIATSALSHSPHIANKIIIELLTHTTIDSNARDLRGNTALHRAAALNNVWATQYLLSKNANPILKNVSKQTPRQFALLVNDGKLDSGVNASLLASEQKFQKKTSAYSHTCHGVFSGESKEMRTQVSHSIHIKI